MSGEVLRLEIANGVGHLVLANPVRGNPLDGTLCRLLRAATNQIVETSTVRSVLISAEGANFSYGGDIAAFISHIDDLPATISAWVEDLNQAILNIHNVLVPVIAVVQGVCAGGMVGFAAAADIVLAARSAKFVSAYAGVGLSCDGGSSITVGRRIGFARARHFYILNRTIHAEEAAAIGLADEIVADEALSDRAMDLASRLKDAPTVAIGEIKKLLIAAQNASLKFQLDLEAAAILRCANGHEAREGIQAFSQKRRPNFPEGDRSRQRFDR